MRASPFPLLFALLAAPAAADGQRAPLPTPAIDEAGAPRPSLERAVFAGGCFWGVQAVFQHVRGVVATEAGYAGGTQQTADYADVSTGTTGHAESVQITYDPHQITYGRLLQIFFSVALNPTEQNRQGPDQGPQYRSEIFAADPAQMRIAQSYVDQLTAARIYPRPIATRVVLLSGFYQAEPEHQYYVQRHPESPYVVRYDLPKIAALRHDFPMLFRE